MTTKAFRTESADHGHRQFGGHRHPVQRAGGRRRKLTETQRAEIADSVLSGRKSAAEMARLYRVSQPTVSRIVAERRSEARREA